MKRAFGVIVLISLLMLESSSQLTRSQETHTESKKIEEMIKEMTIEEKVGQMMMPFFYGSIITPGIERLVNDWHIGGVILFKWAENLESPQQIANLTTSIQKMAKIPLFISIDQEGGIVTRIPDGTDFPGNMALGATRSEEDAYLVGKTIGLELKALGINMNFAPVLDVNTNPKNPVIGVRSFGDDPELVAALGKAYIKGLRDVGIMATGKHFPGHGDTEVDSHTGLPKVTYGIETLQNLHLKPFQVAIDSGIDAIMSAHIIVSAIDPNYPATLSKSILTDLLREKMGFGGIIITDAMAMDAISKFYGPVENATVKAVEAGADVILIPQRSGHSDEEWLYPVKHSIDAIVDRVKSGAISEERIDASVRRILSLKEEHGLFDGIETDPEMVGAPEHKALELKVARDSITLIKNTESLIPISLKPNQKLLIVSPTNVRELGSSIARYHQNVKIVSINRNPSFEELRMVLSEARSSDMIIMGTSKAQMREGQTTIVKKLIEMDRPLIVIALNIPYDIQEFPKVTTYLTGYGYRECTLKALGDVLFGKAEARGALPVTIN
jgi:Beta-glucosidase-related glycosidases